MKVTILLKLLICISCMSILSCGKSRYDKPQIQNSDSNSTTQGLKDKPIVNSNSEEQESKIHVNMYIENSGSMLGYVNGATEFVNVVNDLAQYPSLILNNATFNYYLTSGKVNPPIKKYNLNFENLGVTPNVLISRLNKKNFKSNSSKFSDLKNIFKEALKKVAKDSISMVISDGIYDVGGSENPIAALENEISSTRTSFLTRLKDNKIETILLKLSSNFNDYYHPANVNDPSKKSVEINQKRPYYIWIFGNSKELQKYFPTDRLKKLKGFKEITRFNKIKSNPLVFAPLGMDNFGFREDYTSKNTFKTIDDRSAEKVFNLFVNLKSLNKANAYVENLANYNTSNEYEVVNIKNIENGVSGQLKTYVDKLSFVPSHILTVKPLTKTPNTGEVTISLKNNFPKWIEESNMDNDYPFNKSETQTFGFEKLVKGINDAYMEVSESKNLTSFSITIKN